MVAGRCLGQRVNHAFKAIARRLNEAEFRPECMFAQKLRIDRNKIASCKRRAQVFQLGCLCNQIHGHFIKNLARLSPLENADIYATNA